MSSIPSLTAAQASSSTDTTEGTLSGAVLSAAITSATAPTAQAFTPTAGQTLFPLPVAPKQPGTLCFYVNGIDYAGAGATLTGSIVTWSAFPLGPEDRVLATFT